MRECRLSCRNVSGTHRPVAVRFWRRGLTANPDRAYGPRREISLNYRDNDQYRYYSASVQLFPRLETTLRYTDVRTKQYSSVDAFSGNQTYKDKAFDVKLRLWEESYWMPQVSVGAKDIGGTGLFDAEYIVASKARGPFDFSLGLGWGYLGTSGNVTNPFCTYSDKYCYRDNSYKKRVPSTATRCSTARPRCLEA